MPKPDESDVNNDIDDASKIQSVVETANAEDEKDKSTDEEDDEDDSDEEADKDASDASDEDDSEDGKKSDDDDEDEEDKDATKSTAERKFKNLAADDDATYISNVEKAYENSSAEAIRLSTELKATGRRMDAILQAATKDPDLADRLTKVIQGAEGGSSSGTDDSNTDAPSPLDNPFLMDAQTQWKQKSEKEVQEIVDANPELISDPTINTQVRHWMEIFSNEEMKVNKRLMSGGEAMTAAMNHLGVKDKRVKQDVAAAAKDLAAPTRPQGTRKSKPSAKKVSDSAYKFGELMGVSKENVDKFAQ